MPTYFDEVVDPFLERSNQATPKFGDLCRVYAYYPHERLEIWRPRQDDRSTGIASDFNPIALPVEDAFHRNAPFSSPHLATEEEFLVLRAKRRPGIILAPPDPALAGVNRGFRARLARHLCLVAPMFSVSDTAGVQKFEPTFIERVRLLGYPQFLFLPSGGPLQRDSLARLDEAQSVAMGQLESTGWTLAPDAREVFQSQASLFVSGLGQDILARWREQLLS